MKNYQENFSKFQKEFFRILLIVRNFLKVVRFQSDFQSVSQRVEKMHVQISNEFYNNTIIVSGLWSDGGEEGVRHYENLLKF